MTKTPDIRKGISEISNQSGSENITNMTNDKPISQSQSKWENISNYDDDNSELCTTANENTTEMTDTQQSQKSDSESIIDIQDNTDLDIFKDFKFEPDQIIALQRADNNLSPIIKFLTTGALPKSQKQARKILLLQSQYAMFNDMLYHSRVAKAQRTKTLSHYQLVLPAVLINTVLKLYHESPMGGHGGIQDTLDKIKETYYFDKMSVIVGNYVKSCDDCPKRKEKGLHTKQKQILQLFLHLQVLFRFGKLISMVPYLFHSKGMFTFLQPQTCFPNSHLQDHLQIKMHFLCQMLFFICSLLLVFVQPLFQTKELK